MTDRSAPALSLPFRVVPPVGIGRGRARHLVERNVVAYRRGWIFLVSGFFEPFFYLLSIGLGLNHLVGHLEIGWAFDRLHRLRRTRTARVVGDERCRVRRHVRDLLQAQDRQDLRRHPGDAARLRDVAIGELSWSLIRGTFYSVAFLSVMAASALSRPGGRSSACLPPCS